MNINNKIFSKFQLIISSRFFLFFSFGWFAFQATVIAATTKVGIPPDEKYHYDFIKLFTNNGWSPFLNGQEGFYSLGEAVKTPFFIYHYILSLPNHFLGDGDFSILFLRMINVLFGLFSIYVLYKILRLVNVPKYLVNLAIFASVNTLMFVFISASINYDSLFILTSLLTMFLLLRLVNKPQIIDLLMFISTILVGIHIKKNYLVIAFLAIVVLAYCLRKSVKLRSDFVKILKSLKNPTTKVAILGLIILFLSVVFAQRYISNLVEYQSFEPNCTKVLVVSECRENYVFARNEALDNMERPSAKQKGYDYIANWFLLMSERTYGLFAHTSFKPYLLIIFILESVIIYLSYISFRKYKTRSNEINILLFIVISYTAALMFENYLRYEKYGSFTFAVQGRYALPTLLLAYVVFAYFVSKSKYKSPKGYIVSFVLIITLFIASLPSFVLQTNINWQNEPTIKTREWIKNKLNG